MWHADVVAPRLVGSSGSGIDPMSLELEGRFFTTEPPEKSSVIDFRLKVNCCMLSHSMVLPKLFKFGGFPDSSVGKESACSAGDPSLIPGSGRSPREGIGYPLQYSWVSLVVQLAKNPPAIQIFT